MINDSYRHLDENPNPSYSFVLKTDAHMMHILANIPAFMLDGDGPIEGVSEEIGDLSRSRMIRNTFAISSAHKVLMLHRPFLHRAFRDPRFESSRTRALAASRTILRVGAKSADCVSWPWTVAYHVAAGASIVALDLFQRGSPKAVLDEERDEIRAAEKALREMSEWSSIAARGCALIENLLAEEARLGEQPPAPVVVKKKRKAAVDGPGPGPSNRMSDFTHAAKRVSLGGSSAASQASTTSPGASLAGSLIGPAPTGSTHLSPPASYAHPSLAPSPRYGGAFSPATHPTAAAPEASAFDGSAGGYSFPLPSSLPEEFLSVFLTAGELSPRLGFASSIRKIAKLTPPPLFAAQASIRSTAPSPTGPRRWPSSPARPTSPVVARASMRAQETWVDRAPLGSGSRGARCEGR